MNAIEKMTDMDYMNAILTSSINQHQSKDYKEALVPVTITTETIVVTSLRGQGVIGGHWHVNRSTIMGIKYILVCIVYSYGFAAS